VTTQLRGAAAFTTIGTGLIAALTTRLAGTTYGAPDRASMVPAAIAWDACDCGLLAVSAARSYLADEPPPYGGSRVQRGVSGSCRSSVIVYEMVVQVIRCAPQPATNQMAPTTAQLAASSAEVESDAWHALTGTACYLDDLESQDKILSYEITNQERIGPRGGCVGSELITLVGIEAGAP
jgi:hypothetical protein